MKLPETERLIIREYTMADFDALYEILSDGETMKYYPKPYDRVGTERWLNWCRDCYQRYGFGLFALELKENGKFIGDCGISMQSIDGELLPEIGYHIHKAYWRQGYAKEAARAVKDWFFENTDFDAVYSYMNQENHPSRATAASNGMRRIKAYHDGEEALFVYAITRDEWQKEKRNTKENGMTRVLEFLKKAEVYYLATVEGDQPRVRPFGTIHLFEDKLYIQTGRVKPTSHQLMANPKAELCAFSEGAWLRVACELVEDDRLEAKKSMLDAYPNLRGMYDENDGNTQVFYMQNATATFCAFGKAPEVIIF